MPITAIEPNNAITFNFQLHYDFPVAERRQWIFEELGQYQIKAVVYEVANFKTNKTPLTDIPKKEIYSNEIEVLMSESIAEKEALSDFMNIEDEFLLYQTDLYRHGLKLHTKTYLTIQGFLQKHPKSYLSRRARDYIETEDNAIEEYKVRMELVKQYPEEEARRREDRRLNQKQFFEQLTDQQIKDLEAAEAALKQMKAVRVIEIEN